nr:unnamed protein product [Callosobruchus analis]
MGAGARADKKGKHPRPVAVYFVNRWLRDKVFFAKSNLKGSGVVMSKILTENALQLYKQTKTILGAKNVWTGRDRSSRGGGVGFYIRNDLKYSVLQKNEKIELIWVKVAIGDTSFALSVSYRAPSNDFKQFFNEFETSLSYVFPVTDSVFCLGDFNIDLLDFESTKAKYVTDIIEGFGMKQLVKQPTRITENSATLIDYIVVSNEEIVSDVGTIHAAENEEDIRSFVSRLKDLAKFCDFGSFLDDALRERLVCGVKTDAIKRRLLTEDGLNFERAYTIAIGMELAEGQLKCMGSEQSQVNKLFQKPSRPQSYGQARQASRKQMYGQSGQSSNQSFKHQNSQVPNQPMKKCKRCLKVHWDDSKCPAVNWRCFSCNQTGHTARSVLCKNRVHNVLDEDQQDSEEDTLELGWLSLNYVSKEKSLQVKVIVEGKLLKMEVDSGACKSVMHIDDYNELFPDIELTPVSFKLKVVTGQNVTIIGQADVTVQYEKQICKLPLIILDSIDRFTPLLGRNWLNVINPSWRSVLVESKSSDNDQIKSNVSSKGHESIAPGICEEICAVTSTFTHTVSKIRDLILEVKSEFASNFQSNSKNRIKKFKADVKVKEDVKPIFHRAYEMPYSLKPKVEEELSKMVESGIITKVSHSDWASPIVVVPKRNSNDIRICVDFKKSVNKVIDSEHCVLPLPDDIFASLSGSKFFTVSQRSIPAT